MIARRSTATQSRKYRSLRLRSRGLSTRARIREIVAPRSSKPFRLGTSVLN
jgi:hypothetical protein